MSEHNCLSNLEPAMEHVEDNTHLVSGTVSGGEGFVLFAECKKCGKEFDVEYEYVEAVEA